MIKPQAATPIFVRPSGWKVRLLRIVSLFVLGLLLLASHQAVYAQSTDMPAHFAASQPEVSGHALWSLMQSAASIGAIVLAVLAGLILLLAALVWEIRRLIDDQVLIKRVLDGDNLLMNVFPFVTRKTPTEFLSPPEQESFQVAIGHLLPPGWASEQSESLLDAMYDFINNKEQATPNLALDLAPLFAALKGKQGKKAIRSLVDGLPNCSGMRTMPQPGLFGLPSCLPAKINRRQVTNQIQAQLKRELKKRLRGMGNTQVFGMEELEQILPTNPEEEEPTSLVIRFLDFRKSIIQTRRISWILWLVALVAFMLMLYAAGASSTGIALWLGWPLAIVGVAVFGVSYLILTRIRNRFEGPGAPAGLKEWLEEPLGLWERRVRIWSGGFLAVGVVLLLIGYLVVV